MKNKKQASINISLANYINNNSNNKLLLHTRSINYLANSTKTNRSFQQSSKSKGKCNNVDIKQQGFKCQTIVKESSLSKSSKHNAVNKENCPRSSSITKQNQQSNRNLKNKPTNYTLRQNSAKRQEEGSRNRQEIKSYRKIQISEKQLKRDVRNIQIIDRAQRPHQSQNLRNIQQIKNYDSHKKLYTFCGENKGNRQNSQNKNIYRQAKNIQNKDLYSKNNSQQSINSNTNYYNTSMNTYPHINASAINNIDYGPIKSSIIVKEEQLKRFTHKFARQKIQFQQTIQNLNQKIQHLKVINKNLDTEKRDMYECLKYKQEQAHSLSIKTEELKQHIKGMNKIHQQYLRDLHKQLQQKIIMINNMEQQLINKQNKIQQIQLYIQTKERQYHVQMQKFKERHQNRLFFPLTNVNHAESINTDLSNESVNRFSIQFIEQLELLRLQNTRLKHKQSQFQKSLEFLKIQNQHLIKQLDLEKRSNFCLKQQILEYKFKLQVQKKTKPQNQSIHQQYIHSQNNNSAPKQNVESLQMQISELLAQNATLVHNKQTLQRSLKVSSQMILCLKQQNTLLKDRQGQVRQLQQVQTQKISADDIKKIVLMMMKDQLQLEDKIRSLQKGGQMLKHLAMSQNLQKIYQEGYQSIKRNKNKKNYDRKSKTQQNESLNSNQRNFHTQAFLFEEIQNSAR